MDFRNKFTVTCIPARYLFSILGSIGFMIMYSLRFNLSIAIVSMVRHQPTINNERGRLSYQCTNHTWANASSLSTKSDGEFDWDPHTQGLILSSFFWGYVVTQLPGGRLAEHFDAKYVLAVSIFGTSIFSIFSPIAARMHFIAFIICRIIEGLFQGVACPAMHHMIAEWFPYFERSFLSSVIYSGQQIGTVIALPLTGYLCHTQFLGGWPSAFYLFGTAGIIWTIIWIMFIYETPRDHPYISKNELNYILKGQKEGRANLDPKVPWKAILMSVPLYALIIAHLGHNFGAYLLLTQLPTFFKTILGLDIKKSGLLLALPPLLQAASAILVGYIFDEIIKRKILQTNTIRKFANTISAIGPGFCLLLVIWTSRCDASLTVVLFALSMAFDGFSNSGFMVTHVDMSPDFAGTLMGITNFIANFSGIAAPYVVGVITQDEVSIESWYYCFYLASMIYFISGFIFLVFGSAKLQEWGLAPHQPHLEDELREEIDLDI